MPSANEPITSKHRSETGPSYVIHPSFAEPSAAAKLSTPIDETEDHSATHMPDEVTRDRAQAHALRGLSSG